MPPWSCREREGPATVCAGTVRVPVPDPGGRQLAQFGGLMRRRMPRDGHSYLEGSVEGDRVDAYRIDAVGPRRGHVALRW